jgi:hypothetical protein
VTATLNTDFSGNKAGPWPIGQQTTSTAGIGHGRYTLSADDGYSAVRVPRNGLPPIADGKITALVQLTGTGKVGVMARLSGPENAWNLDACWITNARQFGCTTWRDGVPLDLLHAGMDKQILPNHANTLRLQVKGNRLLFFINGQPVYHFVDRHPVKAGNWGAYVVSRLGSGPVHGQYLHITISGKPSPSEGR